MRKSITCAMILGLAAVAGAAELPAPESHLREYAILKGYFTFGVYNIRCNPYHLPWMEKNLGVSAQYLFDQQVRLFAAAGVNTVVSPQPIGHTLEACRKYGLNYLPYMYYWYRGPFEQCKAQWLEFVKETKDKPNIFGWYVYDEPNGTRRMLQQYIELKKAIYEIDPDHPTVEITSSVHAAQAPHAEYYMWDCYPFHNAAFEGGNISVLKKQARRAAEHSAFINVAVIQATDEGVHPVTPVELRAEVFAVLANGANGVMFYGGSFRHPAWRKWTLGEKYCSMRSVMGRTASTGFGVATPLVREMGRLSSLIVPVGPLLVGAEFLPDTDKECEVSCRRILEYATEKDENALFHHRAREAPAIEVGVWRRDGMRLLIPYSNNREAAETARVRVLNAPDAAAVYDLLSLAKAPLQDGVFRVELEPACGSFYLVATPEEFARERARILRRKADLEAGKLGIRVEMARRCGLLDLGPVDRALAESKDAAGKGDFEGAAAAVNRAQQAFEAARQASAEFRGIAADIAFARHAMDRIDEWLVSRVPFLYDPPETMRKPGAHHDPPLGAGLPELERILAEIRAAGGRVLPLAEAFEKGTAKGLQERAGRLATDLRGLLAKLATYRAEHGPPTRVGFLALPGEKGPLFDADAWAFARLVLPRVEMVRLTAAGRFADDRGQDVDLADHDALWLHYSTPAGAAFLDAGGKIPVPEALLAPRVVGSVKTFLEAGGGLLLSGLATAYVDELGLETVQPNLVELNQRGFVTEVLAAITVNARGAIGLKPVPAQRTHPVFAGLDAEMICFRGEDAGKLRNRASWEYPAVPVNGAVLACLETESTAVPENRHFDLVEFAAGAGRVLACGTPAMAFDTRFNNTGARHRHFRQLQKFVANMVAHLGNRRRPAFVPSSPPGPFCHRDVAKAETNPALKCRASSGGNVAAPYSLNHTRYWRTTEDGAWTECYFGKPLLINKVCVLTRWEMDRWNVGRLRLKVRDDASGEFVDLEPPAVFEGQLVWTPARFAFDPIRTSAVRLEDIRRVAPRKNNKNEPVPSPPVGIHDVVVFGEGQPLTPEARAAALAPPTPQGAEALPGQLLENPSFERGSDGKQGWYANPGYPVQATLTGGGLPGQSRGGAWSLRLDDVPDGKAGMLLSAAKLDVAPGETLVCGLWAKGAGTIRVGLIENGGGKFLRTVQSPVRELTSEWQEVRWSHTGRAGVDSAMLCVTVPDKTANPERHAVIDDAWVRKGKDGEPR